MPIHLTITSSPMQPTNQRTNSQQSSKHSTLNGGKYGRAYNDQRAHDNKHYRKSKDRAIGALEKGFTSTEDDEADDGGHVEYPFGHSDKC